MGTVPRGHACGRLNGRRVVVAHQHTHVRARKHVYVSANLSVPCACVGVGPVIRRVDVTPHGAVRPRTRAANIRLPNKNVVGVPKLRLLGTIVDGACYQMDPARTAAVAGYSQVHAQVAAVVCRHDQLRSRTDPQRWRVRATAARPDRDGPQDLHAGQRAAWGVENAKVALVNSVKAVVLTTDASVNMVGAD